MNNDKIRFGIVGTGVIAHRFAQAIKNVPNAELVAVASRTKENSEKFGNEFDIPVRFDSYEKMACSDIIDAAYIAVPHSGHISCSCLMMKNGKHVLCEKPMATTVAECLAMLAAARESGKRLLIAHNQRMCAAHRKAASMLREGAIGRPLRFATCFGHSGPDNWSVDAGTGNWFFDRQRSAFGAVADLGIHKIDLMRYLLGSEVESVSAMLGTLDKRYADGTPVNVDDNAAVLFRMKNGVIGTVTASWTFYAEEENDTVIYGTEGRMHIDPKGECITLLPKGGERVTVSAPQGASTGVIDAFVEAVLNETPSDLDAEAVFPSMQAMVAAIESSESGRQISL